jgi:hypothetical protein
MFLFRKFLACVSRLLMKVLVFLSLTILASKRKIIDDIDNEDIVHHPKTPSRRAKKPVSRRPEHKQSKSTPDRHLPDPVNLFPTEGRDLFNDFDLGATDDEDILHHPISQARPTRTPVKQEPNHKRTRNFTPNDVIPRNLFPTVGRNINNDFE